MGGHPFLQQRLGHTGLLIHQQKTGTITRNAYTQGEGELAWDTWPNRLVLRLSLQSENETYDPLKSGPAKAGPAGLVTPPLLYICI